MNISRQLPRNFFSFLACIVGLGLIVAWASLAMRIATRQDTLHNLGAILHGLPFVFGNDVDATLPFYNRVFFPGILSFFSHLVPGLSEGQWYILLRVSSFEATFAVFAFVCCRALDAERQAFALAAALLAVSTIATFSFGWEDPSDAIDIAALSLGVLCVLEARFILALAVAVFFASNRESAAYVGVIWFFLLPRRDTFWRTGGEAFAICVASYATTMALRFYVSTTGRLNLLSVSYNFQALLDEFHRFTLISWLPVLAALVVTLLSNIDMRNRLALRFVLLAAVFTVPAIITGHINELRVFLPCFLMLCFAVAAGTRDPFSSRVRTTR